MFREIGDAMLARGYAFDLLFQNMPPRGVQPRRHAYGEPVAAAPQREKRRYLRRALAWSFERGGRALSGAAARLRPAGEAPRLQGCG